MHREFPEYLDQDQSALLTELQPEDSALHFHSCGHWPSIDLIQINTDSREKRST
jgi:hypothetical protein